MYKYYIYLGMLKLTVRFFEKLKIHGVHLFLVQALSWR